MSPIIPQWISIQQTKWLQLNTPQVCIQLLHDLSGQIIYRNLFVSTAQSYSWTSPLLLFWIRYQVAAQTWCNDLGSQLDTPGKGEPQLRNWIDQTELWPFLWGILLIPNWYKRAKLTVSLLDWCVWKIAEQQSLSSITLWVLLQTSTWSSYHGFTQWWSNL